MGNRFASSVSARIELNPEHADAWEQIIWAGAIELGDYNIAVASLQTATDLQPPRASSWPLLGQAQYHQGRLYSALECLPSSFEPAPSIRLKPWYQSRLSIKAT
jgi:tetratricopeptide (TPR) repeat protein